MIEKLWGKRTQSHLSWQRGWLLDFREQFQHNGDKSQSMKYRLFKYLRRKGKWWSKPLDGKAEHQKKGSKECVVNGKGPR